MSNRPESSQPARKSNVELGSYSSQSVLKKEHSQKANQSPRKSARFVCKGEQRDHARSSSVPKLSPVKSTTICPTEYVSLVSLNVIDRNRVWLSRREMKVNALRERRASCGMEECTFEPVTNRKSEGGKHKGTEAGEGVTASTERGETRNTEVSESSPIRRLTSSETPLFSPPPKLPRPRISAPFEVSPLRQLSPHKLHLSQFDPRSFLSKLTHQK